MTKAELVNTISNKLGVEKNDTQKVIEAFMQEIKTSLYNNDNVYLRGFGSFVIKTRAAKTGRNISKNTAIEIPAHIPSFKPSKMFAEKVKTKVKVENK
jgi:DNA-binding protein HU-beta